MRARRENTIVFLICNAHLGFHSADIDKLITNVSILLEGHPSLLQDFNSLLRTTKYRVECPTDVEEVKLFTLLTPFGTRIRATFQPFIVVEDTTDLPRLLSSEKWSEVLELPSEKASCVVQLLQIVSVFVMMNDEAEDVLMIALGVGQPEDRFQVQT
jgi:hypothetical protein